MAAILAATAAVFATVLFCGGCASIQKGDFRVRDFGTDLSANRLEWVKATSNGVESIVIDGGTKDASKSVHTAANLAMAALGAIVGSGGGPVGAGVGAGAGAGLAEIWQTVKDGLQRPQATTPPADTAQATNATPAPQSATIPGGSAVSWPAYTGHPLCFRHDEEENAYRAGAIAAARAAGMDCIRVKLYQPIEGELAYWLLHLEHGEKPGTYLDRSFYEDARRAGVTRWQFDARECPDIPGWTRWLRDYSPDMLQWVLRPDQSAAGLERWGVVRE
jgi:hypothetical protein